MITARRLLWVDDDPTQVLSKVEYLEDSGYIVRTVTTPAECMTVLEMESFDLVIIDIMMPNTDGVEPSRAKGGRTTGLELARMIKRTHPEIRIVGCSVGDEDAVSKWFRRHASGFWLKGDLRPSSSLIALVETALTGERRLPKIFIVHGQNDTLTLGVKNYLQNRLHLGEPVVLREQPSFGRTIIEKLEEEAQDVELVFVLLTPDDTVYNPDAPTEPLRRARQNVIFELGYFFGVLGRRSGKVILLYKGALDIPSDISGIIYIKIDHGIEAAGEEIRAEVHRWLGP
jgi:CheY-like chemotaxis protein